MFLTLKWTEILQLTLCLKGKVEIAYFRNAKTNPATPEGAGLPATPRGWDHIMGAGL